MSNQTSMSLDMMPKMLRNMLATLLMDSYISSWNIRGDESFQQVTIRFSNDKMAATENITYRKAPPSRQARDSRRQAEWKTQNQECVKAVSNTDYENTLLKSDIEQIPMTMLVEEGTSQPKANTDINNIDPHSKHHKQSSGLTNSSADVNPRLPALASGGTKGIDQDMDVQNEHIDNNNIAPVVSSAESENDRREYGVAGECQGCGRVFNLKKSSRSHLYSCSFCESFIFCCRCNLSRFHSHHGQNFVKMTFSEYELLLNG